VDEQNIRIKKRSALVQRIVREEEEDYLDLFNEWASNQEPSWNPYTSPEELVNSDYLLTPDGERCMDAYNAYLDKKEHDDFFGTEAPE
jgi:hypothetical protein